MDDVVDETTALRPDVPKPRYAFESSLAIQRRRRVRQFQCCVCTVFLGIVITALVISVAFTIEPQFNPDANETVSDSFTSSLQRMSPFSGSNLMIINKTVYEDALKAGRRALRERERIEDVTPSLPKDSASYKHQKVVATTAKARSLSKLGYTEVYASKHLSSKLAKGNKFCYEGEPNSLFSEVCRNNSNVCGTAQNFRSYNGSCNNLNNSFGVAYKPYRRILTPDYADGISSPRVGKNGRPLPSAREVSLVIHRPIYKADCKFTVMLAVFGQFLDHDITATALNQGKDGKPISCCVDSVIKHHPECFPVMLDSMDPYYENYNITCMEFVRSAPAPTCCFGSREQLNQATSYIDGSTIYGSDEDVARRLRSFEGGQLKMLTTSDNRTLLPISDDPNDGCNREEENRKGRYCFMTGDPRANENLHLTSMHLLWARQHNRLATQLQDINPHWSEERIFLESRRIVGAQLQHIAYNEFLPIVLDSYMEKFDLKPLRDGYFDGYNDSLDASVANGFAASAFRFAHTLIPTLVKMIRNDTSSPDFVELHRILFNPFELYKSGQMDQAILGAMNSEIESVDPYFTPELKQHMFERPAAEDRVRTNGSGECGFGLDLVSLNIQRGRDHGLPGYSSWREHCGLSRPTTFGQLARDIDGDSLDYIQSIYSDVDDIDFYTGSLSEKPMEGAFLGPTITCVLLEQFVRLKRGDRFWYENSGQVHSFSPNQLQEIRKTSLATIICDNSDDVTSVQRKVMRRVDANNKVTRCSELPKPRFEYWRDELKRVPVGERGVSVKTVNNTD